MQVQYRPVKAKFRTAYPRTVDTMLSFRFGNDGGPARVISHHLGLTVVPCNNLCCGSFDQRIEPQTNYPVSLDLVTRPDGTQFYIAHERLVEMPSRFLTQFRPPEVELGVLGLKIQFLSASVAGGGSSILLTYQGSSIMLDCGADIALLATDTNIEELEVKERAGYPDFSLIPEANFKGILLTHGHMDHYAGLDHLCDARPMPPIYGSKLTNEMAKHYLRQCDIADLPQFENITSDERFVLGPFAILPFPVFHSVRQALGYAVYLRDRPDIGAIVFTGDMKFRLSNERDDYLKTLASLEEIGSCRLLFSDCTNADRDGYTGLTAPIKDGLFSIIDQAPERVFITLFATNVDRILDIVAIGTMLGKKIGRIGESLQNTIDIMAAAGITLSNIQYINVREADIILLAGCQAVEHSAAWNLSRGKDNMRLRKGDIFVHSASVIPGRQKPILEMIRGFRRQGATIVVDHSFPGRLVGAKRASVHTSGHGSGGDIAKVIQTLRPEQFVPYHCGLDQAIAGAEIAARSGLKDEDIVLTGDRGSTIYL